MNAPEILKLLESVEGGKISAADAASELSSLPFLDLAVAKHDAHRPIRNGFSEVIFCEGKEPEHVIRIVEGIGEKKHNVFGTRAGEALLRMIAEKFPDVRCDGVSRTFQRIQRPIEPVEGRLSILCAGTADIAVAEEARRTAQFFGLEAACHYDVGVAGLHRLFSCLEDVRGSDCIIAIAGMEGALPSVLGGLVACPVIAVPTSQGYGTSFKGVTALLAMLNSCSEGISVVNIDNGFGAACAALRIIKTNSSTPERDR